MKSRRGSVGIRCCEVKTMAYLSSRAYHQAPQTDDHACTWFCGPQIPPGYTLLLSQDTVHSFSPSVSFILPLINPSLLFLLISHFSLPLASYLQKWQVTLPPSSLYCPGFPIESRICFSLSLNLGCPVSFFDEYCRCLVAKLCLTLWPHGL